MENLVAACSEVGTSKLNIDGCTFRRRKVHADYLVHQCNVDSAQLLALSESGKRSREICRRPGFADTEVAGFEL